MTIPLFSRGVGRSLLIRRGKDSYGEEAKRTFSDRLVEPQETEGRRLKYSADYSWRRSVKRPTLIARNLQPALDEVFHVRS